MNMRTFAVVLGTVASACIVTANFSGCLIVGTSSSSTGFGGEDGSGGATASSSSKSVSSSSASSSSGMGDGGMCGAQGSACTAGANCCMGMCNSGACDCDPTHGCGEAITMGGDPKLICDGSNSATLYDAYYKCACMGKCMTQCAATYCGGMGIDPPCDMCLQDTQAGCGNETQACQQDV